MAAIEQELLGAPASQLGPSDRNDQPGHQERALDSRVASSSSSAPYLGDRVLLPPVQWGQPQQAIARELQSKQITSFGFHAAPADYYELSLEERRKCLGAPTTDHLCKTLVMRNTKHRASAPGADEGSFFDPEFFCVVVQVCPGLLCAYKAFIACKPHLAADRTCQLTSMHLAV